MQLYLTGIPCKPNRITQNCFRVQMNNSPIAKGKFKLSPTRNSHLIKNRFFDSLHQTVFINQIATLIKNICSRLFLYNPPLRLFQIHDFTICQRQYRTRTALHHFILCHHAPDFCFLLPI